MWREAWVSNTSNTQNECVSESWCRMSEGLIEKRAHCGVNTTHLFLYSYVFQNSWRSVLSWVSAGIVCGLSACHLPGPPPPPPVPASSLWFPGHIFCREALHILCRRPPPEFSSHSVSRLLCFPVGCPPPTPTPLPHYPAVLALLFCRPARLLLLFSLIKTLG